MPDSMRGEVRPSREEIVSVVSRWPQFLESARVFRVVADSSLDELRAYVQRFLRD